jgi:hypothetical protein
MRLSEFRHLKIGKLLATSGMGSSSMMTIAVLWLNRFLTVGSSIADSQATRHELPHVHHSYFAVVRGSSITGISYCMELSHSDAGSSLSRKMSCTKFPHHTADSLGMATGLIATAKFDVYYASEQQD